MLNWLSPFVRFYDAEDNLVGAFKSHLIDYMITTDDGVIVVLKSNTKVTMEKAVRVVGL